MLDEKPYTYMAFMNNRAHWDKNMLEQLKKYAKTNKVEIKAWVKLQSDIIIICLKLPYIGLWTGVKLNKQLKNFSYSLGIAAKEEYDLLGITLTDEKEPPEYIKLIYI